MGIILLELLNNRSIIDKNDTKSGTYKLLPYICAKYGNTDAMTTQCPYCTRDNANLGASIWKCPNCGLIVVVHSAPRNLPHEILKDIADVYGTQTLSNKRLMQNILADIAPWGMEKTKKMILLAVSENIHNKLNNIKEAKKILADENFLSKEIADYLVDAFAYSLGFTQTIKHPERSIVESWFCDRVEYYASVANNNPQPEPQVKHQPKPKSQPKPQTPTNRIDFLNGDYYIGEIQNGQPNGKGKRFNANGGWQEGIFRNGELHGNGQRYDTCVQRITTGYFDGDKLKGKVKYEWDNGDIFKGFAPDNAYQYVSGTYYYKNGYKEKGAFVNAQWVLKTKKSFNFSGWFNKISVIGDWFSNIGDWFWTIIWTLPFILAIIYFLAGWFTSGFFSGLFSGVIVFFVVALIVYLIEKIKDFLVSLPRWLYKGLLIIIALIIAYNIIAGVISATVKFFKPSDKPQIELNE